MKQAMLVMSFSLVIGSLCTLMHFDAALAAQKKKPEANVTGATPRKSTGTVAVLPLTISECTSLGGTVDASSQSCTNAGHFTCKTTDVNGTVRTACIDKK